jgi:hypothetical protein
VIWPDYVVLADDLAGRDSEASKRSAISRAYYGAFNPARRWVEANVGPIDNRSAHRQVWGAFKTPTFAGGGTRAKWEAVGELGEFLRRLRNRADYADDLPDLDRHAPRAVAMAERLLGLLEELEIAD